MIKIVIPPYINRPDWVNSMCRGVSKNENYYLFAVSKDEAESINYRLQDEEYLKLIQHATHLYLLHPSFNGTKYVIYDTKSDFFYNSNADWKQLTRIKI